MKKTILIFILLALAVGLWGCTQAEAPADTRILVSIAEAEDYTVENNGQWVQPGEDAVFVLDMAYGVTLADTDYSGTFSSEIKDGKLELTLEDVTYPVQVSLALTHRFATITYDPNGGYGEETVKTYDLNVHARPNTSIGTDIFVRYGYVLTSWNTKPDGSGTRVGLGSRVTAEGRLTLYAQWEPWTDASEFEYSLTQYGNITINGYTGTAETIVIPAEINGYEVTAIASRAFAGCGVKHVIFPTTMDRVAAEAFLNCGSLETVLLYDNIQVISDDIFSGCGNLRTLYINAIEAPYGYNFRKESCYADKVDLLITASGQQKLVFYSGCSVWYNLNGAQTARAFDGEYTVINMGLNGTVNSAVQMQILGHYLEAGDVLVHTLELTSETQLLTVMAMGDNDDKLWCGLEYNYDLFSLVDLRTVTGELDSLCYYLSNKKTQSSYRHYYTDDMDQVYMDEYGCVPFDRSTTKDTLADKVRLDPEYIDAESMARLEGYYDAYRDLGVTVYVSYACVNMDAVPEDQQGNVALMDSLVKEAVGAMGSAVVISDLDDVLFTNTDFYDTNYHLRSPVVTEMTNIWLRDLKAQMVLDGLWEEAAE